MKLRPIPLQSSKGCRRHFKKSGRKISIAFLLHRDINLRYTDVRSTIHREGDSKFTDAFLPSYRKSCIISAQAGMQSLQQKASEWSGVSQEDAFAVDDVNLYEKLGHQTFVDLATEFYNRVFADDQQWFRSIFANSRKEDAIQSQCDFFIQRMGGPPLFSQRRGHPALIGRHRPFPVTHQAAERWLQHMEKALDSVSKIDADSRARMLNFFRHTAFFLVAGNEMMKEQQRGAQSAQHRG